MLDGRYDDLKSGSVKPIRPEDYPWLWANLRTPPKDLRQRMPPASLPRSCVGMTKGLLSSEFRQSRRRPREEGKGHLISLDWPLFMPATTYAPTHLARAVPSALRGLTSVFGMGTGGSPAVRSPTSRGA